MNKKYKMPYFYLVVSFMVCFVFVVSACQPTPETEFVIGKNDNEMQDSINNIETDILVDSSEENIDSERSPLYKMLNVPSKWTMDKQTDMNNEHMNLNINATITLPNVSKVPVASVSLRSFDQADVDLVAKTFFGNNAVYYEYVSKTKESIEARILSIKKELSLSTDSNEADYREQLNHTLKELEVEYSSAPAESELEITDPILRNGIYLESSEECEGLNVSVNKDGDKYIFSAYNNLEGFMTIIGFNDTYGGFLKTSADVPYGVNISKVDASSQASDLVSQISNDYKLCYVGCVAREANGSADNWGWGCIYMRSINGFPTAYASNEIGEDMNVTVDAPIRYEKITVVVNDNGIAAFTWENPMKIESIENDNVSLLPFDNVEKLALNYLSSDYSDQNERYEEFTVDVTKVELGLMRIKQQNSSAYYYLPVWNVFSRMSSAKLPNEETEYFEDDKAYNEKGDPTYLSDSFPDAWGPITINALDGSRIDRNLGY